MPKGHGLGNGAPAREEVPPFWGSSQENVGKTYGILVDSKKPKIGNIWLFGPFFLGDFSRFKGTNTNVPEVVLFCWPDLMRFWADVIVFMGGGVVGLCVVAKKRRGL